MVIAGLVFAALAIRLDGIGAPPLDLNATRQYHAAILAREYYVANAGGVPKLERSLAAAARRNEDILEPPVLELAAAGAFLAVGGEHLWIPRFLSVLFWIAAGVLLYRLAQRVTSAEGAVVAVALFLFLPFGIVASRSFQPDPLMVMLLVAGLVAIVRYDESPTRRRFLAASALSAAAVISKPGISIFFLGSVMLALSVARLGPRGALTAVRSYGFILLSCAPTGAYYLYGTQVKGFLRGSTRARFIPQLLDDSSFWSGWLKMVAHVVTYPGWPAAIAIVVIALVLCGTALAPRGRPRAILIGLIVGYCLFGLAFTYHIHTHDYYSLPLIVIVSLSVGNLAAVALPPMRRLLTPRRRPGAVVIAGLAASIFVWQVHRALSHDYERRVRMFEHIGQTVGHSRSLLFLDRDYGLPLEYHGLVAGLWWPSRMDLRVERLTGLKDISPRQRFEGTDPNYFPAVPTLDPRPEFFIVTDLTELAAQPRLKKLLFERFPVAAATRSYVILDMRPTSRATRPARVRFLIALVRTLSRRLSRDHRWNDETPL